MTTKQPSMVEDLEQLSKDAETFGTFLINVIHAKDLMYGDTPVIGNNKSSDPFARIKWPNGKSSDTAVRDGTITPKWNQLLQQKLKLNKLNIPLISVEVYDHDTLSNDLLGSFFLDINECVMNPGQWKINQNFKLDGAPEFIKKKFEYFGEIYLQGMFLEKEAVHDGKFPEVTENLDEIILKSTMKGKIVIRLIDAKGIPAGDNNGKSDPYVNFEMPDKGRIKSKCIDSSVNPIWNQELVYPIKIVSSIVEDIRFMLIDKDPLGDDELAMGTFGINE